MSSRRGSWGSPCSVPRPACSWPSRRSGRWRPGSVAAHRGCRPALPRGGGPASARGRHRHTAPGSGAGGRGERSPRHRDERPGPCRRAGIWGASVQLAARCVLLRRARRRGRRGRGCRRRGAAIPGGDRPGGCGGSRGARAGVAPRPGSSWCAAVRQTESSARCAGCDRVLRAAGRRGGLRLERHLPRDAGGHDRPGCAARVGRFLAVHGGGPARRRPRCRPRGLDGDCSWRRVDRGARPRRGGSCRRRPSPPSPDSP